MKQFAAIAIATGVLVSGCAPPTQVAYRPPIPLDPWRQRECAMIWQAIADEQYHAQFSGVMATSLVEAAMRLNSYNVVTGLQTRAAIIGCG